MRWANERPLTWLPQTPSWSSVKSSSTLLGCKYQRYDPPKDLRNKMRSIDNQYAAIRCTLSASFPPVGTQSSTKRSIIESIQQGSNTATTEIVILASMLGPFTTSTLINYGTSPFNNDAKVARESACRYWPLTIWMTFTFWNKFIVYSTNRK